jgi:FkbM family methyltransferase
MISQHYFTFPFQIPRVIGQIRNWPLYLSNYLLRRKQPAEYEMRNGFRLIDGRGTLAGTIAVVFVRREYGPMDADWQTIVDIGANMGSFAVYAAMTCPKARIFGFEPEERNFGYLSNNIAVNSLQNRVKLFQCAVASTAGEREMAIGESPLNSLVADAGSVHRKVQCTTLGNILDEQKLATVDMLKMNCEGAEYEIFESCSKADLERVKRIRLEYHTLSGEKQNGEWLAKFLESQGYQIEHYTRYRGVSGFIWASRK